ncbi:MAG: conjugal transfer protein TraG N-terminal domain-containing protein [Desulfobacterales bacterium]|nr:conjugal transfer protein TraG N-terminal domain-containing protein [Desulfobacterales bacterium]
MKNKILIIIFSLFYPSIVFSAVPPNFQTFTVHGNFDVYANAFKRMALIMSDNAYGGLFFVFIAVGFFMHGIIIIFKNFTAQKGDIAPFVGWIVTTVIGVSLFFAFIKPKDTINIYDETNNKSMAIGGVPEGIIIFAGIINKIQIGIIDIIETSSDPNSYINFPNGLSYYTLANAFKDEVTLDNYLSVNLNEYIRQCFIPEITRTGTTLNLDDINKNMDFMPILEKAKNPAQFMVYKTSADPVGTTMTCEDAWNNKLKTEFTNLNDTSTVNTKFWEEKCGSSHYGEEVTGSSGANIIATCREKAATLMSNIFGSTITSSQAVRQYFIANTLHKTLIEENSDNSIKQMSGFNIGSSMLTTGIAVTEWMPLIQAILFSIFLSLMPFLILFLPTPIFGKVCSFIFGIFIFFCSWEICNAVFHSMAMSKASQITKELVNGELGLKTFLLFSNDAMKAYAVFGYGQLLSVSFAAMLAGVLTKFGGNIAGLVPGAIQSGAGQAGGTVSNPMQHASAISGLASAGSTELMHNAFSYNQLSGSEFFQKSVSANTNLQTTNQLGNGDIGLAANRMGSSQAANSVANTKTFEKSRSLVGGGNTNEFTDKTSTANAIKSSGSTNAYNKVLNEDYNGNIDTMTSDVANGESYSRHGITEKITSGKSVVKTAQESQMKEADLLQQNADYGTAKTSGEASKVAHYANTKGETITQAGLNLGGFSGDMTTSNYEGTKTAYDKMKADFNFNNMSDMLTQNKDIGLQKEVGANIGFDQAAKESSHPNSSGDFQARITKLDMIKTGATSQTINENDAKSLGVGAGFEQKGQANFYNTTSSGDISKTAEMGKREQTAQAFFKQAADQIKTTGQISPELQNSFRELAKTETGRAALATMGKMPIQINDPEQADNISTNMGIDLGDDAKNMLSKTQADVVMKVDDNGNVRITSLDAQSGVLLKDNNVHIKESVENGQAITAIKDTKTDDVAFKHGQTGEFEQYYFNSKQANIGVSTNFDLAQQTVFNNQKTFGASTEKALKETGGIFGTIKSGQEIGQMFDIKNVVGTIAVSSSAIILEKIGEIYANNNSNNENTNNVNIKHSAPKIAHVNPQIQDFQH